MSPRNIFVATYPPRRCGIATFTLDLAGATGDHEIAVLQAPDGTDVYPTEVRSGSVGVPVMDTDGIGAVLA